MAGKLTRWEQDRAILASGADGAPDSGETTESESGVSAPSSPPSPEKASTAPPIRASRAEWAAHAEALGIDTEVLTKQEIIAAVQADEQID